MLLFSSCTIIRKAPKDKPYLIKNTIEVKGGKFTKVEKQALIQRLNNQLDDSSKIVVSDAVFVLHFIKRPHAFDTGYAGISARNMQASMFHLGYYNARVNFSADTTKRQVHVKYFVDAGRPTLIDTVTYRLRKPDLQQIAIANKEEAILVKHNPVTKAGVLGEISRLVDSFRNNGYYKFTAAELLVRGDTTIAALTSISDDPVEQLRLIAEAQQKKDSPEIKLAIVLNPPADTSKLTKYYINKIYILPDYQPGDNLTYKDITQVIKNNYTIRYHKKLFRTSFLLRNILFKSGDMYRQDEYLKMVNRLSAAGVWQNVNIRIVETPDSTNKIDLILELIPGSKWGFETKLEASYSATSSNANRILAGNLFGLSGSLSLTNRNVAKEAIRMTHTFRAGVELNNKSRGSSARLINSEELSYNNTISFPRLITPFPNFNKSNFSGKESFINTGFANNKRLNLFTLQSINLNHGYTWVTKGNFKWVVRPVILEFNILSPTAKFDSILNANPFLRYSYNTALVAGMGAGVSHVYRNPRHLKSIIKERTIKLNMEESGLTWSSLPILKKYKKKFIKTDLEYKYNVEFIKNTFVVRLFAGVGVPLEGDSSSLPFFKQYFGGGSNSMRGWPARGIGRGGQRLIPFSQNIFNDRTGDIQLESNIEYRYDIARIIPNTLTLRGALFMDIGNVWNFRNLNPSRGIDSAQFVPKNIYKQLGLSAGTGFRLDFNYFILRFDFGFRFKRPELSNLNNGWKAPSIGFDDFFKKFFSSDYRQWRYENFNFTVGIGYPF